MASRFPKRNYDPRPRRERGAEAEPRKRIERPRPEDRVRPKLPSRRDAPAAAAPTPLAPATAWDQQASWYDQLQGEDGDEFYRQLILPAVIRRLDAQPGERVLDVCCGQGVLGRALSTGGVATVGVDAAEPLIVAARARAGALESYLVGDGRKLGETLASHQVLLPVDHAALVMALQDLDPIAPVLAGAAAAVRTGGRVVIAMTHPAFRIPRRSSWGWDENQGVQFRRLDGYISPLSAPIKTHPGQVADTKATTTFHRPLSSYVNACGAAGLGIVAADELCSHRRGTKGPRFGAEDRAAKEFPLFLVLTAVRL